MTILSELKKLAEAATVEVATDVFYVRPEAYDEFIASATPQQVLKMIECMKLMADALESCAGEYELSFDQHLVEDSLAAFNKLNEVE